MFNFENKKNSKAAFVAMVSLAALNIPSASAQYLESNSGSKQGFDPKRLEKIQNFEKQLEFLLTPGQKKEIEEYGGLNIGLSRLKFSDLEKSDQVALEASLEKSLEFYREYHTKLDPSKQLAVMTQINDHIAKLEKNINVLKNKNDTDVLINFKIQARKITVMEKTFFVLSAETFEISGELFRFNLDEIPKKMIWERDVVKNLFALRKA